MADADIPSRIEIMKLKAIVTFISEAITSLQNQLGDLFKTSNILVAENVAKVSVTDCTLKVMIMLKHNKDQSFGIFFPEVTTDVADGVNVISDLAGNKFRLFQ